MELERQLSINGMDLNPEKTHIFRINIQESYHLIKDCFQEILSNDELNKAFQFFHKSDTVSYLVRKYYLRLILSKLLSVAPRVLVYKQTPKKKPAVNGLEFNSSHSGNYAVIAVSPNSIGIDIEKINESFEFKSIADCCYREDEQFFLHSGNALANFYYLWTRKEAILKASAEGITDALFILNCLPNEITHCGVTYKLITSFLSEGYILTIAAKVSSETFQYWNICC